MQTAEEKRAASWLDVYSTGKVFTYIAMRQRAFEMHQEDLGHASYTTFMSDFSVCDYYGVNAVRDTYLRSKHLLSDYKMWTELVVVLNHKSWQMFDMCETDGCTEAQRAKFMELGQCYSDLYCEARNAFYDRYGGDEETGEGMDKEATQYFFKVTD